MRPETADFLRAAGDVIRTSGVEAAEARVLFHAVLDIAYQTDQIGEVERVGLDRVDCRRCDSLMLPVAVQPSTGHAVVFRCGACGKQEVRA